MKRHKLFTLLSLVLVGLVCFAGFTGFQSIRLTPKSTDTYTIDSRNTSNTTTFSVTPAGVVALTSVTGTGVVDATNIANITRNIYFYLGGAVVDGGDDLDDASEPDLKNIDSTVAAVWEDSGETTAIQWSFLVPSDYATGMVFYALVSSDDASGAASKLDWAIISNADDTGFASPTAQDLVACTSATLDASNEVLTLTPDATGAALFVAGRIITIEVFNASTNDDDLELKAFWAGYTATQ